MFRIIFLFFIIQLPYNSSAQPDYLYAHHSQPFYTAGDIIWSKVYFLDTDSANIKSRVVYVDLLSPSGELLHVEKLQRRNNFAEWSYQLPFDLSGGFYTLRYYTLWNMNFKAPVVHQYAFELLAGNGSGSAPIDHSKWEDNKMVVGNMPIQVEVRTEKETYKKGEIVKVYLEATKGFGEPVVGHFSVSITDAAWIPPINAIRPSLRSTLNQYADQKINFLQKFDAETNLRLEGKAYQKSDQALLETNYLSLHLVEQNQYFQEPSITGEFRFDVPDFYGNQNAQIHNLNPYQPPLPNIEHLQPWSFIPNESRLLAEAPFLDSLARNRYLFLMRKQRKFRELFGQAPTEVRSNPERSIAYGTPTRTYNMNNFLQLISVEEFIDEVILTARLKGDESDRNVFLQSTDNNKRYERPAWFQVDGFLISDAAYALSIPFSSVNYIDIYSDKENISNHFPSILSAFGVIGIKTKDGTLPSGLEDVSNRFEVLGYHYPYTFEIPPSGEAPDFRPLVHWEVDIQTDESGQAWFEFETSDALGTFILQAEGVSINGEAGAGNGKYLVK